MSDGIFTKLPSEWQGSSLDDVLRIAEEMRALPPVVKRARCHQRTHIALLTALNGFTAAYSPDMTGEHATGGIPLLVDMSVPVGVLRVEKTDGTTEDITL